MNAKLLLAGDLLGSILFALGAVGRFGGSSSLLPESLQFPGHNLVLITLGIALIVPYMLHVLKKGKQRRKD